MVRDNHLSRSQKLFMVFGLLVLAPVVHLMLCDWKFERFQQHLAIVGFNPTGTWLHGAGASQTWYFYEYGLAADNGVTIQTATVYGCILPIGMMFVACVIGLGKHHVVGKCRCGYDLTGNVSGRCPECGEVCNG